MEAAAEEWASGEMDEFEIFESGRGEDERRGSGLGSGGVMLPFCDDISNGREVSAWVFVVRSDGEESRQKH